MVIYFALIMNGHIQQPIDPGMVSTFRAYSPIASKDMISFCCPFLD